MVNTASGAKGQRFESSRAYHKLKHLGAFPSTTAGPSTPIKNRILDDSDSQLTRASKGSGQQSTSKPEVCSDGR